MLIVMKVLSLCSWQNFYCFKCHLYADDLYIYISSPDLSIEFRLLHPVACLFIISIWMPIKHFECTMARQKILSQWADRRFCHPPKYLFPISGKSHEHLSGCSITNRGHSLSPLLVFPYIQSLNKNSKLDFQSKSPFCPLLSFPLYDLVQATIVTFLDHHKLLPVSLWILCSLQPFISALQQHSLLQIKVDHFTLPLNRPAYVSSVSCVVLSLWPHGL